MSNFKAGFACLDVTPPLGVNISGYYNQYPDGILDNLYASAIAVNDGSNTAVAISLDIIGIPKDKMDSYRKSIAEKNSIPLKQYLCTYTYPHRTSNEYQIVFRRPEYNAYIGRKLSDVAALAIADLKPATVSIGRSTAPGISFVRRSA